MVKKYVNALENRDTNASTGEVWSINDVPNAWKKKVEKQVLADGYEFDKDGTVKEADDDSEV